jgi:hypothetical protein
VHPGHRHSRLRRLRRLTSLLLGRRVRVSSAHRAAGEYLLTVLGGSAQASDRGDPELDIRLGAAPGGHLSVSVGDAQPFTVPIDEAPTLGLAALNRQLCYTPGPLLTVHAAGATRGRGAVILLGGSGAGKSTLVAGLTRAGWTYLSDEACGIDDRGDVHPYARPIVLRPGSWAAFPELAQRLPCGNGRFATSEWHVPATLLGSVAHEPMPVGAVIEIRHEKSQPQEESQPAELISIGRGEALERMAAHSCNLKYFGQVGLERLARTVRRSECYRLVFSDLTDAVTLVDRLG